MQPVRRHVKTPPAPSRAGTLRLVGGAPCFDFANTCSGRGTDRLQEHLRGFDLLLLWGEHAGLISRLERRRLARDAARRPVAAGVVLRRALALREAVHAIGVALANNTSPPPRSMDLVNRELAAAMRQARLRHHDGAFAWTWDTAGSRLDRILWPIARSFADIVTTPLRRRVKQCPDRHCGWMFLDTTKNGRRRWCAMSACGSHAKVRRYRARRRQADQSAAGPRRPRT